MYVYAVKISASWYFFAGFEYLL